MEGWGGGGGGGETERKRKRERKREMGESGRAGGGRKIRETGEGRGGER